MTIHRHNPRRDANELEIVHALRQVGCRVLRLSGAGVPDLAVYWPARGGWVLAEIKTQTGRLRPSQREWGPEIAIWRSLDEALGDLGIIRSGGDVMPWRSRAQVRRGQ